MRAPPKNSVIQTEVNAVRVSGCERGSAHRLKAGKMNRVNINPVPAMPRSSTDE